MPNHLKQCFSDYKLNLVQILDSDKFPFYNNEYSKEELTKAEDAMNSTR